MKIHVITCQAGGKGSNARALTSQEQNINSSSSGDGAAFKETEVKVESRSCQEKDYPALAGRQLLTVLGHGSSVVPLDLFDKCDQYS